METTGRNGFRLNTDFSHSVSSLLRPPRLQDAPIPKPETTTPALPSPTVAQALPRPHLFRSLFWIVQPMANAKSRTTASAGGGGGGVAQTPAQDAAGSHPPPSRLGAAPLSRCRGRWRVHGWGASARLSCPSPPHRLAAFPPLKRACGFAEVTLLMSSKPQGEFGIVTPCFC